jgi:hypothetical protein
MLAKLTIELAKKGQFNAASLRARVLKEMKAHRQSPLGTDARLLHLAFFVIAFALKAVE